MMSTFTLFVECAVWGSHGENPDEFERRRNSSDGGKASKALFESNRHPMFRAVAAKNADAAFHVVRWF
jgi:hypothetical protein